MKKAFAIIAVALFSLSAARAELVYGNLGPTGTDDLGGGGSFVTDTQFQAQGFRTPTSGGLLSLSSITLGLNVNVGTSSTQVQLFAGANNPTGAALATVNGSVSSPTPALYTFTLGTPLLLDNDTVYWVVLSDPDGGQQFNWVYNDGGNVPSAQNGSGYTWPAPGTVRSANGGVTWTDRSTQNERTMALYVTADAPAAVPEPGTWAAAALLAGGAAFMRWRKRAKVS
jgi:hypothetical protein